MQMRLITMHNDLADSIDVVLEVFPCADDEVFTDLVETLSGHRLQCTTHHWVVFEDRVRPVTHDRVLGTGHA